MKLAEIKEKMLAYRDFYGGDLLRYDEIKAAKTKRELEGIIQSHHAFLEDSLSDAKSHLDEFKKSVGLQCV